MNRYDNPIIDQFIESDDIAAIDDDLDGETSIPPLNQIP